MRAWFTTTEDGKKLFHLDVAGDGKHVEVRPATEADRRKFPERWAQSEGLPERDPRLDLERPHGEW